ncbi:hypothetical protein [Saccharopolyspora cebuensis]|uniref:Uncharacterized protein n=1 Tax=Saccharopolyspora cebuensis TaxID=418759 RepID=A0ABV4CL50_9PSEU
MNPLAGVLVADLVLPFVVVALALHRYPPADYGSRETAPTTERTTAPIPSPRRTAHWVISPDQSRFHLSTRAGRAVCGHPLRGDWARTTRLDALRPGQHTPCLSCIALRGTDRQFYQAANASGPPQPAEAARPLPPPSTWTTDELPLITAYCAAARRTPTTTAARNRAHRSAIPAP